MLLRFSPGPAGPAGLTACLALAGWMALGLPAPVHADPNAFAALAGSWRGSGVVSPTGTQKERVLCRVTYTLSGSDMRQTMDCAGTDYKISVTSDLKIKQDAISGKWQETTYGIGGGVSGLARGNQIFIRISSQNFQGRMSIKVGGDSHTVDITQFDPGSGQYTHMASITLRR